MMQQTPAQMRADAEDALRRPGEARRAAKAELSRRDKEVRPAVVRAVSAEVPFKRITELTGIAPNTARAWHEKDVGGGAS